MLYIVYNRLLNNNRELYIIKRFVASSVQLVRLMRFVVNKEIDSSTDTDFSLLDLLMDGRLIAIVDGKFKRCFTVQTMT